MTRAGQPVIRVNAEPLHYLRPLRLIEDRAASHLVKNGGTVAVFAQYEDGREDADPDWTLRPGEPSDSGLEVRVTLDLSSRPDDLVILASLSTAQDAGSTDGTAAEREANVELTLACVRRALFILWGSHENPDEFWDAVEASRTTARRRPGLGGRRRR